MHRRHPVTRFLGLVLLAWLSTAAAGCTLLEKCTCFSAPTEAHVATSGIEMFFESYIHHVDNTHKPGAIVPGLAGRVYIFGDEGKRTISAKGKIVAELFDMTNVPTGASAERITGWTFEARALKMLARQDKIGLGYTLFLPLEEYRPDIKKVQLRLAYLEEDGTPHACVPATLTLRNPPDPVHVQIDHHKALPAGHSVPRR